MAEGTPERGEGRVINGRYRLLRTLGAGGMGRVWLAHDAELACQVAVKEIALPEGPPDQGETSQRIARARSEARHAARLRGHPHVATVHDVVIHEGLPWIVMEYVPDAVDLQAKVRGAGPLPPDRVARIGLAVLDALTAGHRIGILHRDVKPANILLAPDASGDAYARVLLTDYGIALMPESHEPRLTATAGILGTPGYLAPERARGEPPTPAADLFSLGATLYAAVEGRGPFDRHGDYATLTALLAEEPTPPVRAGDLAPVLHGLLVKDPVRRSAPEAVARGLERVVQQAAARAEAADRPAPQGGFGPPPVYGAGPYGGAGPHGGAPPYGGAAPQNPTPGVPPGYAAHTPQARPLDAPPGYAVSAPQGYAVGGPQGQAPYGPYGHGTPAAPGYPMAAPGTPQTPAAPPPPNTPHTPHTPVGGPAPGGRPEWVSYANSPTAPYAGSGVPASYPGGPGVPGQGPTVMAPPGGPGRRRSAGAVVAVVAAVALVIGLGTWAAVSLTGDKGDPGAHGSPTPSPTGPVYPYGEQVGLQKALQPGDCVHVVWTGTAFASRPNLGVVNCAHDNPDGQVMAVDSASDYADASAHGAQRCGDRTRQTAASLPDAQGYALLPTKAGFTAAGRGTACLVLGRTVPIGGDIGNFRDAQSNVWATEMSVGDCWMYVDHKDYFTATLNDCKDQHTDQVIGFTDAPRSLTYKNALGQAAKLCSNKFASTWAPGSDRVVYGYMTSEVQWNQGYSRVVCTVARYDHGEWAGAIPAPGNV
ncbi:serine/threonine-protein kinase [Streptomyces mangrovisoli]|uniref:non-specific serine/threonine protein kinase n=1 Tax=Streptomyces mangrovisoli TaxID=1428628 RepID=A0A1J4P524_9ACTN|nr:serine/threonine-protein kinase [Streptomyces mangrovisoli]OIJ69715.1 serine/threonine protein kinase [Streptomyces mangrovisoli]